MKADAGSIRADLMHRHAALVRPWFIVRSTILTTGNELRSVDSRPVSKKVAARMLRELNMSADTLENIAIRSDRIENPEHPLLLDLTKIPPQLVAVLKDDET